MSRGSLKPEQLEERIKLISPTLDYAALGSADLIIEAVFENMALKKEIFTRLDAVARPGAILGTNTSTLDIDDIASVTRRPQDVIGLHFFSPANVMQLLEIVQAGKTAPDVVVTALDFAKRIRKTGVVAKVCYGFIGNRMMDPYGREAERCVLEGATPAQVDGALEQWGMAMGILAVYDMAGVDVGYLTRAERKHLLPDDPTFYRPTAVLYEHGWLGQKSGRGYYRYDGAERKRTEDPEVIALLQQEAQRLNVPQRKPGAQEIQERCLYAMINEGRAAAGRRRRAARQRHRRRVHRGLRLSALPRRPDVLRRHGGAQGDPRQDRRIRQDARRALLAAGAAAEETGAGRLQFRAMASRTITLTAEKPWPTHSSPAASTGPPRSPAGRGRSPRDPPDCAA